MKTGKTSIATLLAVLSVSAGSRTAAAQEINPSKTMVPVRIQAQVSDSQPADSDFVDTGKTYTGIDPLLALDEHLPKWIQFSGIDRLRFEGYKGLNFKPDGEDAYLLNRFRLGMTLKPARWLKIVSQTQDARAVWKTPPVTTPYVNHWDLRMAYVELGDPETQAIDIRVGRQDVNFGAGRLIGSSDWRQTGRTFDAALASFHAGRFRLSAFSLSIVNVAAEGISHHQQGNNVHGLYGGIDNIVPNSVFEPYLFWRVAPGLKTEAGKAAHLDEKTIGLRWAGVITSRFEYAAEFAGQTGRMATDSIGAFGGSLVGRYTISSLRRKPRFFAEFNFASGDSNPKDGRRGTFDQLYPTVHDRHGIADQIGWQNLKEFRTGVRAFAARRWAVAGIYNNWYLWNARDGFYNSSAGIIARDTKGLSGTHIGQEFDAETSYRLNRQIEIGAGIGHIFPGQFLKATTPGKGYTYPYFMLNYIL